MVEPTGAMRTSSIRQFDLRRLLWVATVLLTYLTAYSIVTWPWVIDMWTQVKSGGDEGMFLWGFWWMRHAVEGFDWPYFTNFALAPEGGNLLFNGLQFSALLSVPVQWVTGTALAYNLTIVVVVLLAGLAMYGLARDFELTPWSALLAGLLFAAGPHLAFRYGGGHLNLAHAFWIPLLLLLLRRYLRAPTIRRACVGALALAGSLYTDFTIAIFSMFLCGGYLIGLAFMRRAILRRAIRRAPLVVASALLAVLLLPLGFAVASAAREGTFGMGGLGGSPTYSNDLLGLFLPNTRIEGPGHLGLAATILATVAVIVSRLRTPIVIWLALAVIACAVFSLGPHLVIADHHRIPFPVYLDDSGEAVSAVMPFTWIQAVFHDLRVPQRFLLLGSVPLALLAAYGAEKLSELSRTVALVTILVAVAILLAEARTPGGPSIVARIPDEYRVVSEDPDTSGIVVDVPLGIRTGFTQVGRQLGPPLIYAMQHEHPVAVGFFGRLPVETLEAVAGIPLYRDLIALQDTPPGLSDPAVDPVEGHASALKYDLKYVVLHQDVPGADRVRAYLLAACYQPIETGEIEIYRLSLCGTADGNSP